MACWSSSGTSDRRPPSRWASARMSAQPVRGGSSSNSTTGTLCEPVCSRTSFLNGRNGAARYCNPFTSNSPIAACDQGLGIPSA